MVLLAGCSTTSLQDKNQGGNGIDRPEPPRPCCINPGPLRNEHDDPNSILFKRSAYFDFDQYTIKDEFKPLVEAHARYLAKHREIKVFLTGHADARGGREYNVALGQKRAESVRSVFSLFGVADDQMEAVSYGAEQPKAQGNNEAAWAENRRVDILYK